MVSGKVFKILACITAFVFFAAGMKTVAFIEMIWGVETVDFFFVSTFGFIAYFVIFGALFLIVMLMGMRNIVHDNKKAAMWCGIFLSSQSLGLSLFVYQIVKATNS